MVSAFPRQETLASIETAAYQNQHVHRKYQIRSKPILNFQIKTTVSKEMLDPDLITMMITTFTALV